jgi:ABC-type glycerol-3-phosphate transport system substrate-binding protein
MLVIALLLLAAYGGPAISSASPTTAEQPVAAPVLAQDAVTIKFLTWNDEDSLIALEKMAEAFTQSDPQYANVNIEFNAVPFEQLFPSIETAVATGAEMDMFAADGPDMKHYAYNEAIVSLADYYTEEELAEWVPQSVEEGSFNGTSTRHRSCKAARSCSTTRT